MFNPSFGEVGMGILSSPRRLEFADANSNLRGLPDILMGIDGQPITNLQELFSTLQTAKEKKPAVKINLKRFSESDSYSDRVYDYLERSLTIEDLKYIGPSS